jgi:hypothetical protein
MDLHREAKLALEEAVREADIAVQACVPNLEELEKIKVAFDSRLGRVAKMLKPEACPIPRNPSNN